jgi:hypothetical protein
MHITSWKKKWSCTLSFKLNWTSVVMQSCSPHLFVVWNVYFALNWSCMMKYQIVLEVYKNL